MAKKKEGSGTGLSSSKIKDMMKKMAGSNDIVVERQGEQEWISTGSTLLDISINQHGYGGIPIGKISSIAGLPSTGKSYLALQIAKNAQDQGITVVYYDSEAAINLDFVEAAGIDVDDFILLRPNDLEQVTESIEEILKATSKEEKVLFIWDSIAFSESRNELAGEMNLKGGIAEKPRLLGKFMNRVLVPLANKNATLLILNQLRNRIPQGRDFTIAFDPYFTPGGNAIKYAYSLEIWLTTRRAKSARKENESGNTVGVEVVSTLRKSRFGTPFRQATFYIDWEPQVRVADEESWLEPLKLIGEPYLKKDKKRYSINLGVDNNGEEVWSKLFFESAWSEMCKDPAIAARAREILETNFSKVKYEDTDELALIEEDARQGTPPEEEDGSDDD